MELLRWADGVNFFAMTGTFVLFIFLKIDFYLYLYILIYLKIT